MASSSDVEIIPGSTHAPKPVPQRLPSSSGVSPRSSATQTDRGTSALPLDGEEREDIIKSEGRPTPKEKGKQKATARPRPSGKAKAKAAAPTKTKPVARHGSESEVDDFFSKRVTAVATKRGPKRAPAKAAATARQRSNTPLTTVPTTAAGPAPAAAPPSRCPPPPSASSSSSSFSSSPSSSPDSPRARGRGRPTGGTKAPKPLPEWTRSLNGAAASRAARGGSKPNRKRKKMGEESDEGVDGGGGRGSEEESEEDEFGEVAGAPRKEKRRARRDQQGRERSTTRSLTPPERMEDYLMQMRVNALRENIGPPRYQAAAAAQVATEYYNDEADDLSCELDPLLLRIRNAAAARAADDDDVEIVDVGSNVGVGHNAEDGEGGTQQDAVTIRVSMIWDPDKPASAIALKAYQKPIEIRLGVREPFSSLYAQIAEAKSILATNLVLTYNHIRVYPFGTPFHLSIISSADFKAYTSDVFERVQRGKRDKLEEARARRVAVLLENDDVHDEAAVAAAHAAAEEELEPLSREASRVNGTAEEERAAAAVMSSPAAPAAQALFKISVRGSATNVLPLAVKPSMTIGALLKQYCKKFNVSEERRKMMWIEYDGEKLDPEKAVCAYDEIEQEETVDVVEGKAKEGEGKK